MFFFSFSNLRILDTLTCLRILKINYSTVLGGCIPNTYLARFFSCCLSCLNVRHEFHSSRVIIIKLCGGCLHSCNSNLSYCKLAPIPLSLEIGGFNVIPAHDLSVSATVLYQLGYNDPYTPLAEQNSANREAIT